MIPVFYLLFVHFFADFILQTHWMATNKSKMFLPLFYHILVYSSVTTLMLLPLLMWSFWWFFLVTFVCHFATDFISSRISSKLWIKQEWHWFFVVIGFDQLLHYAQLLICLDIATK